MPVVRDGLRLQLAIAALGPPSAPIVLGATASGAGGEAAPLRVAAASPISAEGNRPRPRDDAHFAGSDPHIAGSHGLHDRGTWRRRTALAAREARMTVPVRAALAAAPMGLVRCMDEVGERAG